MNVSPVAERIAETITPMMQAALADHREAIIHDAGGLIARGAATVLFPAVVRQVPNIAAVGADALLTRWGGMSVTEVVSELVSHMQAKGLRPHSSFGDRP